MCSKTVLVLFLVSLQMAQSCMSSRRTFFAEGETRWLLGGITEMSVPRRKDFLSKEAGHAEGRL